MQDKVKNTLLGALLVALLFSFCLNIAFVTGALSESSRADFWEKRHKEDEAAFDARYEKLKKGYLKTLEELDATKQTLALRAVQKF